jgi:hypothetical protein
VTKLKSESLTNARESVVYIDTCGNAFVVMHSLAKVSDYKNRQAMAKLDLDTFQRHKLKQKYNAKPTRGLVPRKITEANKVKRT